MGWFFIFLFSIAAFLTAASRGYVAGDVGASALLETRGRFNVIAVIGASGLAFVPLILASMHGVFVAIIGFFASLFLTTSFGWALGRAIAVRNQ